ncbi:AraC family transcriptional regulator [Paenibacillus sp. H1-7]|uniref:helix-turn-helix transcriptional regulator n=1 Tax=Paenibacillus sp. H1-7 TaxID=2282849 RepID=UPI001EF818B1|nr:AraC family transcriptional regulator [Paenibacillus sp. H1-7]
MNSYALYEHIPKLTYYRRHVRREQFFEYESVQKEWLAFAVEDGSFYYEIGDRQGNASFGDLVFCPPDVPFRRVVISPVTLFVLRMNWEDDSGHPFRPETLNRLPIGKISLHDTGRLTQDYADLKRPFAEEDRRGMISRNHYFHHIWMMICEQEEPVPTVTEVRPIDPLIQQAVKQIQSQAFERLHLYDIAASIGISRFQLCKKFHDELGTTPSKYLTSLRLDKAKKLLTETTLTLDQISECCGYQNGFYLSRVFKNNCGMTPMQYRKEHGL